MKVNLLSRTFYDPLGYKPKKVPLKDTVVIEKKISKDDGKMYDHFLVIGHEVCKALGVEVSVNIAICAKGIYLSKYPLPNSIECYLYCNGKHKRVKHDELIEMMIDIFGLTLEYGYLQSDDIVKIDDDVLFIKIKERIL